jgi:hypothetical protein
VTQWQYRGCRTVNALFFLAIRKANLERARRRGEGEVGPCEDSKKHHALDSEQIISDHDSLGGMDPRLTFRGGGGGVGNLEEEEEEEEESCPQNITLPPVRVLASAHGYLKPPPTQ